MPPIVISLGFRGFTHRFLPRGAGAQSLTVSLRKHVLRRDGIGSYLAHSVAKLLLSVGVA
jgi:hypothetical protein